MDLSLLIEHLIMGSDLFGFVIAIFTNLIGAWAYLLFTLLVSVPFYIRYQSIVVPAVLWLMFGSLIVALLPSQTYQVGAILLILGFTAMIWKLFRG